jgi:RHS repeat-associated protein
MKGSSGYIYRRFIYDGSRLLEERDYYNAIVGSYVYGPDGQVITRRGATGQDVFYHANSLGSTTALTGPTGTILERYKYDAYGRPTILDPSNNSIIASTVGNPLMFAGAYWDGESGNYYMWHREYDTYLGRFLQRDPMGESESLNLYAYVRNNPINMTDPTGLVCSVTHLSPEQEQSMAEFWDRTTTMKADVKEDWAGLRDSYSKNIRELGLTTAQMRVGWMEKHHWLTQGNYEIAGGDNPSIRIETSGVGPAGRFSDTWDERGGFSTVGSSLGTTSGSGEGGAHSSEGGPGLQQSILSVLRNAQRHPYGPGKACHATRAIEEGVKMDLALWGLAGNVLSIADTALAVESIPAIGRLPDTVALASEEGLEIINSVGWSEEVNAAWIQNAIQEGKPFFLASPITEDNLLSAGGGFTMFGQEVSQILNAGYRWVGDYLIPPL